MASVVWSREEKYGEIILESMVGSVGKIFS